MDTIWITAISAFAGGSVAAALFGAVGRYYIRPIIGVSLDENKGSYVETTWRGKENGELEFPVKVLRLYVENTGLSSIRDCSGYITKLTKWVGGVTTKPQQEVLELGWSHKNTNARDIPRAAFFHMDVVSLHLKKSGRELHVHQRPNSLEKKIFDNKKARYEFEILVAVDNAAPLRTSVSFTYDPQNEDLRAFEKGGVGRS